MSELDAMRCCAMLCYAGACDEAESLGNWASEAQCSQLRTLCVSKDFVGVNYMRNCRQLRRCIAVVMAANVVVTMMTASCQAAMPKVSNHRQGRYYIVSA